MFNLQLLVICQKELRVNDLEADVLFIVADHNALPFLPGKKNGVALGELHHIRNGSEMIDNLCKMSKSVNIGGATKSE